MIILVSIVIAVILIVGIVFILSNRHKENSVSFRESIYSTNLPIVTFYNKERELNFILDTGANQSVINRHILEKCTFEKSNEFRKVMGIEGVGKIESCLVDMVLTRDGRDFNERFQVSDLSAALNEFKKVYDIEVHGFLGSTFFVKYKCVLDFDSMAARIKQ